MSASNGTSNLLPVMDFDTGAGTDLHSAIGLYFAAAGGHTLVSSGAPLPVTATITPFATTADDNNIAAGATLEYIINLEYVYYGVGGTDWLRLMGAIHDSPAQSASTIQFAHVGGFVTTAELTLAVADGAVETFNTQGRQRVVMHTTPEDGSIDAGTTVLEYLSGLNYFYNRDTASPDVWNRWLGGSEDNTWAQGFAMPFVVNLNYVNNGTTWVRVHGGVDNAAGPGVGVIQSLSVGGQANTGGGYTAGDFVTFNFDLSGNLRTTATVTPFATTADDNSIPTGATLEYLITLPYYNNRDVADWERIAGYNDDDSIAVGAGQVAGIAFNYYVNLDATIGGEWQRMKGRNDDNTLPSGEGFIEVITLGYANDPVSTDWKRILTASPIAALLPATYPFDPVINAVVRGYDGTSLVTVSADTFATAAPGTIVGIFTAGVVSTADPVVVAGKTAGESDTTANRLRVDALVSTVTATVTVVGNHTDGATIADTYTDAINGNSFLYAHKTAGTDFQRLFAELINTAMPVATIYGLVANSVGFAFDAVGGVNAVGLQAFSPTATLSTASFTFALGVRSVTSGWDGAAAGIYPVTVTPDSGAVTGTPTGIANINYVQPGPPTTGGGTVAGDGTVLRSIIDVIGRGYGTGAAAGAVHPMGGFVNLFGWDVVTTTWQKLVVDTVTAGLWVNLVGPGVSTALIVKGTVAWSATLSPWADGEDVNAGMFFYDGTNLITMVGAVDNAALPGTINVPVFGGVVRTADGGYTSLDAFSLNGTDLGSAIVEVRSLQPNVADSTTANLASAATFTGATQTQTFYSGTRGRTNFNFWLYYVTGTGTDVLNVTLQGRVAAGTFRNVQVFAGIESNVITGSADMTAFDEFRFTVNNASANPTTTLEFQSRVRVTTG